MHTYRQTDWQTYRKTETDIQTNTQTERKQRIHWSGSGSSECESYTKNQKLQAVTAGTMLRLSWIPESLSTVVTMTDNLHGNQFWSQH